jgi:hypothetical protein
MTARSLAAAALVVLVPLAGRADSLSCPGGIVATGDAKLDLLGKCGRAALEERRTEESAVLDVRYGGGRRVGAPVERWTYDFGRSRFVQVVTLARGRVTAIERGGYGYAEKLPAAERPRRATCEPSSLAEGKLKLEVLARCGEPAAVDAWDEEVRTVEKLDRQVVTVHAAIVTIELWTYDFGRNQLLRFVRIEDGKVAAVETGSYGYAD